MFWKFREIEKIRITEQPKDQIGERGSAVEFHVEATGTGVTYRWQCSYDDDEWFNTKLPGYNTDTLSVTIDEDRLKRKYRCIVAGEGGLVISAVARVKEILNFQ